MIIDLVQQLSPTRLAVLKLIGKIADQFQISAWLVGGFVRDAWLHNASLQNPSHTDRHNPYFGLDFDIVFEGNPVGEKVGIEFGVAIQQRYGGQLSTHPPFGTATWYLDNVEQPVDLERLAIDSQCAIDTADLPANFDFVTARREHYPQPAALPVVAPSTLDDDLRRRDFTINTLAISLNSSTFGELVDHCNGVADLRQGLICVLHDQSFVEDPTRILRAVRYAQRFGFTIEAHTKDLLQQAAAFIEKVTAARLWHELQRICEESNPEFALLHLDELGVLRCLHPHLRGDDRLAEDCLDLRNILLGKMAVPAWVADHLRPQPIWRLYWALTTFRMPSASMLELHERLQWDKATHRLLMGFHKVEQKSDILSDSTLRPSQVTAILEKADLNSLALFVVAHASQAKLVERVERFYSEWRFVRPLITGENLAAMQIKRGPIYRQILQELQFARLDGEVKTQDDEIVLVGKLVEKLSK